MGQRVGQKIKMTSLDELLCVPEVSGTTDIQVEAIYPFENHPFKVEDDERMDELVDSIKANGVLTPVIVRPDDEGTYEMISGHRRLHAAKRAGLKKIPAIVKQVTDDEATIMMVDANVQREEILPSEKAFAYKMRYEAMRRQAGRPSKDNSSLIGRNFQTDVRLAEEVGESRNQVHRLMRLTEVIPELLELVDIKKLALYTAVEISYLPINAQKFMAFCEVKSVDQLSGLLKMASAQVLEEQRAMTKTLSIANEEGKEIFSQDFVKDSDIDYVKLEGLGDDATTFRLMVYQRNQRRMFLFLLI